MSGREMKSSKTASLRTKRRSSPRSPVCLARRDRSLNGLYTYREWIRDIIRQCMIQQNVHVPFIPQLITEYMPLYSWQHPSKVGKEEKSQDTMKVSLKHCETRACNEFNKFGAVLGSQLDPRVDHVISVKLEDGIEFGVGICDKQQLNEPTKRDFMCKTGGFGYYNYKTKSPRMKPKYPPGLYCQTDTCHSIRDEKEICQAGDVLTMVVQRQDVEIPVPGGGRRRTRSQRTKMELADDSVPIKSARAGVGGYVSLSYYLNGRDMGFHIINLKGPFNLCLNYYFVESTIRILSDYRFRARYNKALRSIRKMEEANPSPVTDKVNPNVPAGNVSASDPPAVFSTMRDDTEPLEPDSLDGGSDSGTDSSSRGSGRWPFSLSRTWSRFRGSRR